MRGGVAACSACPGDMPWATFPVLLSLSQATQLPPAAVDMPASPFLRLSSVAQSGWHRLCRAAQLRPCLLRPTCLAPGAEKAGIACVQFLKDQRVPPMTFLPIASLKVKPVNDQLRQVHCAGSGCDPPTPAP